MNPPGGKKITGHKCKATLIRYLRQQSKQAVSFTGPWSLKGNKPLRLTQIQTFPRLHYYNFGSGRLYLIRKMQGQKWQSAECSGQARKLKHTGQKSREKIFSGHAQDVHFRKQTAKSNWEAEELRRDFSNCVILTKEKVDFKSHHGESTSENTSDFQLWWW